MIFVIVGELGSDTDTAANKLSEKLGIKRLKEASTTEDCIVTVKVEDYRQFTAMAKQPYLTIKVEEPETIRKVNSGLNYEQWYSLKLLEQHYIKDVMSDLIYQRR